MVASGWTNVGAPGLDIAARSKAYDTMPCVIDCGIRSPEIRRPEYERCELYEPGDFKTRFKED